MPALFHVTAPLPEAERNARVYAGDIIVFRGFSAVADLVGRLREQCRAHLGADPERAHERMTAAGLERAAGALREAVQSDEVAAQQLNASFRAIGMELEATYGDGLKQRVLTADGHTRLLAPLAAHRDTWGSNLAAQTNWWAPVFPTTPERSIALFPAYFEHAVANDSAGWDFAELQRRLKTEGPNPDYPLLPTASEAPPRTQALTINLVPGDLMCFSGAHLHASVRNTTERTRLSFETRTLNGHDVAAGRGAPNVDGRAVRTLYHLFRHLIHGRSLGTLV